LSTTGYKNVAKQFVANKLSIYTNDSINNQAHSEAYVKNSQKVTVIFY